MENVEDIYNGVKEHFDNPTITMLDGILKKVGKIKLYKQWFKDGKRVKLEYSNKRDDRKHTRIYLNELTFDLLLNLTSSATVLLFYIFLKLENGQDSITLNRDNFVKVARSSNWIFNNCVRELIEKEWIFRSTDKNIYWINLCRFNKGNAEEIFKNYEISKARPIVL